MSKRNRYQVTISECKSGGRVWNTGVLVEPSDVPFHSESSEAIEKAVCKLFGKSAHFSASHGMGQGDTSYGQVVKSLPNRLGGGANCITGQVRLEVSRG